MDCISTPGPGTDPPRPSPKLLRVDGQEAVLRSGRGEQGWDLGARSQGSDSSGLGPRAWAYSLHGPALWEGVWVMCREGCVCE